MAIKMTANDRDYASFMIRVVQSGVMRSRLIDGTKVNQRHRNLLQQKGGTPLALCKVFVKYRFTATHPLLLASEI
jgi:hypothetical protein